MKINRVTTKLHGRQDSITKCRRNEIHIGGLPIELLPIQYTSKKEIKYSLKITRGLQLPLLPPASDDLVT